MSKVSSKDTNNEPNSFTKRTLGLRRRDNISDVSINPEDPTRIQDEAEKLGQSDKDNKLRPDTKKKRKRVPSKDLSKGSNGEIDFPDKNRSEMRNGRHVAKDQSVSKDNKLYKCTECDLHFLKKSSLVSHRPTCSFQPSISNRTASSCPFCNLTFNRRSLYKHIQLHHEKQKLSRKDLTIVVISNRKSLITTKYIKAATSRAQLFKCEGCDAHFLSRCSLRDHMRRKKHDIDLVACQTCDIQFPPTVIARHVDIHHGHLGLSRENFDVLGPRGSGKFSYVTTDRQDNTNTGVSNDLDETDVENVDVDLEESQEKQKELNNKLLYPKRKDSIPPKSVLNSRKYKNKKSLITTKEAIRRIYLFKCKDCDAHFLSRGTLRSHVVYKRHGIDLVPCETCNFKFTAFGLDRHLKIHHDLLGLSRENFEVLVGLHGTGVHRYIMKKYQSKTRDGSDSSEEDDLENARSKVSDVDQKSPKKYERRSLRATSSYPKRRGSCATRNQCGSNKIELFKCAGCDVHYLNKYLVRTHRRTCGLQANGSAARPCPSCKLTFNQITLKRHVLLHHKKQKLSLKDFKITSIGSGKYNNNKSETTESKAIFIVPLFKCEDCDAHFIERNSFYRHLQKKRHDMKLAQCETCNIKFSLKSRTRHTEIHHDRMGLGRQNFEILVGLHDTGISRYATKYYKDSASNGINNFLNDETDLEYADLDEEESENNNRVKKLINKSSTAPKEVFSRVYLFKCEYCEAHFLTNGALAGHTRRERHNVKLVSCAICKFKFTANTLNRHVWMHHDRLGLRREHFEIVVGHTLSGYIAKASRAPLFKCEECDAHFLARDSLRCHMLHNRHDNNLVECETCNIKFTPKSLARHVVVHHDRLGLRRENFEIVVGFHPSAISSHVAKYKSNARDGNSDSDENDLENVRSKVSDTDQEWSQKKHEGKNLNVTSSDRKRRDSCSTRNQGGSNKLFKCGGCNMHFFRRDALRRHRAVRCIQAGARPCPLCKLTFSRKTLKIHIFLHHKIQELSLKDFKIVAIGGGKYNDNISKTTNAKVMSRVPLYKCEDCDAHFINRRSLKAHLVRNSHDNKLVHCEICNLKFSNMSRYRHVEIQHVTLGLRRENFEIIVGLQPSALSSHITKKNRSTRVTRNGVSNLDETDLENADVDQEKSQKKYRVKNTGDPYENDLGNGRRKNSEGNKNNTKGTRKSKRIKQITEASVVTSKLEQRIKDVTNEGNAEQSSIDNNLLDPSLNSEDTVPLSVLNNSQASVSNKFRDTTQNELFVPRNLRCCVVIERTMSDNVRRYIERKAKHTLENEPPETDNFEDDDLFLPHNSVSEILGDGNESISVKTEYDDEDITLHWSDDDTGIENNDDCNYEVKDEIDERNKNEIDDPDNIGPETKIFEVDDSVLVPVKAPYTHETLDTCSMASVNNDVFVKIKDVFSLASLENEEI